MKDNYNAKANAKEEARRKQYEEYHQNKADIEEERRKINERWSKYEAGGIGGISNYDGNDGFGEDSDGNCGLG